MASQPDSPTSAPPDERSRRRWRTAFVVVLLILPVQLVFGRLVGEPYPNVILPSFAEAPTVNEAVAVLMRPRIHVETREGADEELELDALLGELPSFTHYETYKKTFLTYKTPPSPGTGGSWQRRLLNSVRASTPRSLQPRYSIPVVVGPDTVEWLRTRLDTLGFAQPEAIRFEWISETHPRLADGSLAEVGEIDVIVERRVALADPATGSGR